MNIDKDLMQYCIDVGFPVDEMDMKYFKKVEKSCEYSSHMLNKAIGDFKKEIIKKIEHRMKVAKDLIEDLYNWWTKQ